MMANYKNLMVYIQENGVNKSLISGLSELQVNPEAIPNNAVIDYAMDMGYLYGQREEDFLHNIQDWYGPLSPAQSQWLEYINRRIRLGIVVRRKGIECEESLEDFIKRMLMDM